jgi:RimJ/RimL family protein N-acetyltransferase
MKVVETDRTTLRRLSVDDAEFIVELLNDPSFIRNIGDKGVRSPDDARDYILNVPVASYERFGFGLCLVELRETGESMGICGLLKRDTLDDADLGFAFLPKYRSQGYAAESAQAVVAHARQSIGLERVMAITLPDNQRSIRLLEKLGFKFEKLVRLSDDAEELMLFARELESL